MQKTISEMMDNVQSKMPELEAEVKDVKGQLDSLEYASDEDIDNLFE